MDWRKGILWGLGAAQLAVAWFACNPIDWADSYWIVFACAVVLYAQPYLAGIWICFGNRSLPWRMLVVAACLAALTWLEPSPLESLVLALSPGIAAAVAWMLLARAFGWRLRDTTSEPQAPDARKYQFSLGSLLKWTTIVAILFSLAGISNPAAFQVADGQFVQLLMILLVFHTLIAGIAVAEFAILLGMRSPWIGLVGLVSAVLLLVGLFGRSTGQALDLAFGACCLIGWLAVCMLPLRLLGYRFGRCRPTSPEPPASDALADCPFCVRSDLAD